VIVSHSGLLLLAAPAVAFVGPDDGAEPGEPLSPLATILIFGGLPLLLFVVITLLVLAPSMAKAPRYRPDLGWWAAPVWFNGPASAPTDPGAESGATPATTTGPTATTATTATAIASAEPTSGGGGARARW
jgi:hypothetical protein